MNISVAMAKYIKEQLNSIVKQISKDDEIVICDDNSTDNTVEIIKEFMQRDKRIKLYINNFRNVVLNFEEAIKKCKNEIIFLSDQDDIWENNKIMVIRESFKNSKKRLILHNAVEFCDSDNLALSELIGNMHHGVIRNLYKSCYWGCCMAFKSELKKEILPFPKGLNAHDQWIGIIAEYNNDSEFINSNLIKHRIHGNNVSKKLNIIEKINFRKTLCICLIRHYFRDKGV